MTSSDLKLPEAVERVLIDAAAHPRFLEELLERRLEAVEARGYTLTPSEQAMLQSVPEAQLRAVIDRLRGIGEELLIPSPPAIPMAEPAGIRPDHGLTGIRPEDMRIKGTRPGRRLFIGAAATAALGGTAYYLLSLSMGSRPDPPAEMVPPPADAGKDSSEDSQEE
jgi:hypothetical protein